MAAVLPVVAARERLVEGLLRAGALVLSAPTGSGKSTQAPKFLLDALPGRIVVLEPRRLSARSLAARVASERGTPLGGEVGYAVRFENRTGPKTRLVFQTYGVFASTLAKDPALAGVSAVVLDEFHERTLDADLALAWLKALRARRPELKVLVMSATLAGEALERYLPGAARLEVEGRLFPVETAYRPLTAARALGEGVLGALQDLARGGLSGSVLVFLPGLREIRRAREVLGPWCRAEGFDLRDLHGGMDLAEQQELMVPGERPRVILATNLAETGLTVPGVTAVVDSGLHRVAAHDPARGLNTLYLSRISRANADQRAGRAGRTAPGRCVRLWSRADEAAMAPALKPEIERLELSSLRLRAAALPAPVDWLTQPPPAAWESAGRALAGVGALDAAGRPTPRGLALARYPAPPRAAAVLEDAKALGPEAFERACAMVAAFEAEDARRPGRSSDLAELAADLLAGERGSLPRETREAFRQLLRLGGDAAPAAEGAPADALARAWLRAFPERLAAREGEGAFYRLADGRGVLLAGVAAPPSLILALEARERAGGGQARRVEAGAFLPVSLETVEAVFPGEAAWTTVAELDPRAGRVVKEERLVFRGLTLERREAERRREDRKATAELWAEKYASGESVHPGLDDKLKQTLVRLALARRLYPDYGFPEMSADDWRLIYGEAFAGKNNLRDIERVELGPAVSGYLGKPLAEFLEKAFPVSKRLPSGRLGKFLYHETNPAELSARIPDFAGMKGTLALCEGRLPVVFDILAPNWRTVQKTADLTSFWTNAYPALKKELSRRYPRHPWP